MVFRSGHFKFRIHVIKIMDEKENDSSVVEPTETPYKAWINEDILKKRLSHEESGSVFKQLLVTIAMCFGSFSFGNIISWGGPSLDHIKLLTVKNVNQESDYAWLVVAAPMAGVVSILIWAFLTNRIGAKRTILLQTPVLLISWFLKGYVNEYKLYWTAHFFAGFCAYSYIYAGQILLVRSTHRKYIKIYYALFKSSIMLGVLSMNIISKFCDKATLCTVCASMPIICFLMVIKLPDSPVFLMLTGQQQKAEKALKFYSGKYSYNKELNSIIQYVQLMKLADNNTDMIQKKVVYKAILIIFGLQIFRSMTGYYAFLLDSVRIFTKTDSFISPYDDNIIFGAVVYLTDLIGTLIFLHGDFKLKVPMMLSIGSMGAILTTLGFVVHYEITKIHNWLLLVLICLFGTVYNFGMEIIPSIILYQYMPFQTYDFIMNLMTIFHWFMVFCIVRCYMWMQLAYGISLTYWVLASISLVGLIYIGVFVIEAKGKSLTQIQIELGGTPVGSRGSKRQRIPNPFQSKQDSLYLRYLSIAEKNPNLSN